VTERPFRVNLQFALLAVVLCAVCSHACSLSAPGADQRRKKLGSSLKRLRWDPTTGTAIEKPARSHSPSAADPNATPLKLDTLLVVLDVAVTAGRSVDGLNKDDFTVLENDHPQEVASVARGNDATLPRSIILLVDSSSSQQAYFQASIEAAKNLVTQLAAGDEMAIVTDDVELAADFTSNKRSLTLSLDLLLKRARASNRPSRSLQFTALLATLRELLPREGRRPIIIFQTDGDEAPTLRDQDDDGGWRAAYDRIFGAERQYGLNDVYFAAEKSKATIYAVIPSDRLVGLPALSARRRAREMLEKTSKSSPGNRPSEQLTELFADRLIKGQEAAARVAELTGGWTAFLEKPESAAAVYSEILADIYRRYVISYYPTNQVRDGQFRRVRIEVQGHPDYIVHGRSGYYAPGPD
jgi:VWFA-related protein